MKSLFIFLPAVIIINAACAQIPNADFETWTNTSGYNMPTGWGNLNPMTAYTSIYTCTKGTPGYGSSSAFLQLTSRTVSGMGVMPGVAVSGTINMANYRPVSGFACSSRPANLTGVWQYMPSASDQGYVAVLLSKWNASTNTHDTVAYAVHQLSGMVMSWTAFSIPLTYVSGDLPDTAAITLSASGSTPVTGSYLSVDALAFSGNVPGGVMTTNSEKNNLIVCPNPATGLTNIMYHCQSAADIKIYLLDMTGRILSSFTSRADIGDNSIPINVSQYSKGVYCIRIVNGDNTQARKLVVE